MILTNRWQFFDKRGNNMNLNPLVGVKIVVVDPTEAGYGAELIAYTNSIGVIIHVELKNGGSNYSGATYLSFRWNSNQLGEVIWDTDPSDLTIALGTITSFIIPVSTQNANWPYPNTVWNGENYFDNVSVKLIESEQIFILEEVIDSTTGLPTYTYPRIDEYGPYSFTSYEGDGKYIRFIQVGHPFVAGMEFRLYGGSPYDGNHIVSYATKDSFYIENATVFPSTPGIGLNYGIVPKVSCSFLNGDGEIFYYIIEYRTDYPIISRGTELEIVPTDGSAEVLPDTFPIGNAKYIRSVNTVSSLKPESAQINLGIQADYEGIFAKNVVISDVTIPYAPKLIAQINMRGETVGEDERLGNLLETFGQRIMLGEELIMRTSEVEESYPDYQLLNQKRKELLLEYSNIFPYLGSYKGLVNIVNWFGYPDLRIKEYWLNIDKNDQYFGKFKQTQIPLQLKNKGKSKGVAENAALLPNTVYKKTSLFGLYYDITRETGDFDEFGTPTTEDAFMFSNEEVLIKLFALKVYLKEKFMPLNARIIDIVGEGIYFERYAINAWKDDVNIFTITPTNTADFKAEMTDVFVRDLRIIDPTRNLPNPSDNISLDQYYSTWDVESISVVSGGGGFTDLPVLTIDGDSLQDTVALAKIKSEPIIGAVPTAGGIGYAVSDIISLGGGVYDSPILAIVTTVGGLGDVLTFDIIPGPNQGSNYSVLPVTFWQTFVTTIVGLSYAPGLGSGFEIDSNLLTYTINSIRLSQKGLGYINKPTYTFTPAGFPAPVLDMKLKELSNNNLIGYFSNEDGIVELNDYPNVPVGAIVNLEILNFNVSWDDASPYTWMSLEGSEEATIIPIVSYLPSGTGQLLGFTILDGGIGYKTAPAITITGGGGFGATATCTILDGSVNTVTLVGAGSGYYADPDVKVDGGITNTLYSWENIGKGDYYEMEWRFLLTESPQNQQFTKKIRGTVGNLEKYQVMLPYIGKYDVEVYLYDTDNNFTNEYKNKYLNIKLPQVQFSYITRSSDCRDTWDEFGTPPPHPLPTGVSIGGNSASAPLPTINDSTTNDTPVSWDEIFGRWINPIYVNTTWEDSIVKWTSLETSEIDTINKYNFPPCVEFPIERLSPYDLKEGKILSVDMNTNTIICDGQIYRPELKTGDRIYLRRDLNIFEYEVATAVYSQVLAISPVVFPGDTYVTAIGVPTVGGTGVGLTVDIIANGVFPFEVLSITINNPGTGYSTGDVMTINQLLSSTTASFEITSTTPPDTTITVTTVLPNGLSNNWDVLREIDGIIEIPGNVIYDPVTNLDGFKIGNWIKIKGNDDIPKVPRIPVTNVTTNPMTGLYQGLILGPPYDTDVRFLEVNEIGQLYKLRDLNSLNGNLNWNPTIALSTWVLRPVLQGPYPGLPSDYIGKFYINSASCTAIPMNEIRPGFTIITIFIKDTLGNLVYTQRLRTIHIQQNLSTSGPTWDIWQLPPISDIIEIDVEAIDKGRLSEFITIASTPGYITTCEYEYENFPTRVNNVTAGPGTVELEFNFNTNTAAGAFDASTFPPTILELSENQNWFYDHGIVSGDFSLPIINTGISNVTGNTLVTVLDTDYELGKSSGSFLSCSRDFDEDYAEQRLGTLILQWKNFNENRWTQMCAQTWDTLSYHESIYCGWILNNIDVNGRIQYNDDPIFEFQTITGAQTLPYGWRYAYEELINTDNSGMVRFYYSFNGVNTITLPITQVIGNSFILADDVTGLTVGDTMIGLGIPYNASIGLITPLFPGYQIDLVEEDTVSPVFITETLSQRVEFITNTNQQIIAAAKSPGADSLGFLNATNGVYFWDNLELGAITICHTFPLGHFGDWLKNALIGGNQGGRDRLILRYPNLQTYFYEGINPSGERGWYPSENLNYLYDSLTMLWQSYRLPYERSICGSWSYEETKIGHNEVNVPTGSSVLLVPDNCTIAGKTGFRWRISEQLDEEEYLNLVETIDDEIMWTFSHPGKYNIELTVIDTNGNVAIKEKKQFITVYDEE